MPKDGYMQGYLAGLELSAEIAEERFNVLVKASDIKTANSQYFMNQAIEAFFIQHLIEERLELAKEEQGDVTV